MQYYLKHGEVIIDEEFKRLLPPLAEKVFTDLEQSILKYGVRDPLVLWNNILIDGYNRYEICQRYDLPFNTVDLEFPSRDNVIVWIIKNQMERRNLTPVETRRYRGIHYNTMKRIIKNETGKNQYNEVCTQNGYEPQEEEFKGKTADFLAGHYNVSRNTIVRDGQVASAIDTIGELSPDIKKDILSGKTRISNKQLQELSSASTEDVKSVISQIEDGTFESRKPSVPKSSNDNIHKAEDSTDMEPWEIQFTKMTEEFRQMIRTRSNPNDTSEVKSALRQYIEMLVELYSGI